MALDQITIVKEICSGRLVIDPITPLHLQPAGVQLSLGGRLARMKPGQTIDPGQRIAPEWDLFDIDEREGFILPPGAFVLGHTIEKIAIANDLLAMIDGRSTMGRCGLTPHQAAMALWPGHGFGPEGPRPITLELKNQGEAGVVLRLGLFVANLTVHRLEQPVSVGYDQAKRSKYSRDLALLLPRFNGELISRDRIVSDPKELLKI